MGELADEDFKLALQAFNVLRTLQAAHTPWKVVEEVLESMRRLVVDRPWSTWVD